jgi:site-specific DNA-methyltransferase (adenine-specific)
MQKLFHGDCFNLFKKLKDCSVDFIITDPPYFLDSMDSNWSPDKMKKQNSHISNLPIGMKFDPKQGKKFEEFMTKVSKELYRIIKPGGFFLCFSAPRLYHNLAKGIEESGFEIRDQISWNFEKSQVKAFRQDFIINNDKTMTSCEKIKLKKELKNFRTPQLKPQFEPICVAMKPIEGRFIDNYKKWKTGLINFENCPRNVLHFPKPTREIFNTHPTVKPVQLIEHLISVYCSTNGTVLDPFIGSGTTAVACLITKRNFIGSEINKEYIDITKKRIKLVPKT